MFQSSFVLTNHFWELSKTHRALLYTLEKNTFPENIFLSFFSNTIIYLPLRLGKIVSKNKNEGKNHENTLPLLPSAVNFFCSTFKIHCEALNSAETLKTGYPICFVHVDITWFTGLLLAFVKLSHKSSENSKHKIRFPKSYLQEKPEYVNCSQRLIWPINRSQ